MPMLGAPLSLAALGFLGNSIKAYRECAAPILTRCFVTASFSYYDIVHSFFRLCVVAVGQEISREPNAPVERPAGGRGIMKRWHAGPVEPVLGSLCRWPRSAFWAIQSRHIGRRGPLSRSSVVPVLSSLLCPGFWSAFFPTSLTPGISGPLWAKG